MVNIVDKIDITNEDVKGKIYEYFIAEIVIQYLI